MSGGEQADPSLSGPAVAVYGAAAHQEKKREERLGDSPVFGSAVQGFTLEPPHLHTVPGSLCQWSVWFPTTSFVFYKYP